jgi:hypothetical protein
MERTLHSTRSAKLEWNTALLKGSTLSASGNVTEIGWHVKLNAGAHFDRDSKLLIDSTQTECCLSN